MTANSKRTGNALCLGPEMPEAFHEIAAQRTLARGHQLVLSGLRRAHAFLRTDILEFPYIFASLTPEFGSWTS